MASAGNALVRISLGFGAALFTAWLGALPALSAEAVKVRAWPHDGFGRIVFEWSSPVSFEARIDEGALVVRFEREFEADYGRVRQHLGAYVGEIAEGPDGLSVEFALLGPHGLKATALDNLVVIDLTAGGAARAAAPASAEAEPGTVSTEVLRVRTGIHPGFTRVVFDWTVDVTYEVSREDGRVNVAFGRPATVDLAALNRRPPRWIESAGSRIEGGRLTVELGIPESARLRDFRSGSKVVVDILGKIEEGQVADAALEEAAPEEAPAPEPAATPAPAPSTETAALADAVESPPPEPEPPAESEAAAPQSTAVGEPAPLLPEDLTPAPGEADSVAGAAAPTQRELAVRFPETEGLLRLAIGWNAPVAAAVFERAGHVWAVFDRTARASFDPIPPALSETLFLAEQVANSSGTALRFKVRPGLHPTVSHVNGVWGIEFAAEAGALRSVIGVERESAPEQGPRVFLPVAEAGNLVEIEDPEVGDRLSVVPVHGQGQGVAAERSFLQFAVLPTAQGVAILPRADPIAVRTVRNGIEITSREELILSDPAATGGAPSATEVEDPIAPPPGESESELAAFDGGSGSATAPLPARLFEYERWRYEELGPFFEARRAMRATVAGAPPQARNAGRWELATLNFAHGFYLEALGVMDVVAETDPGIASDPVYRSVRGAVMARLGRWDEAAELLGEPTLDGSPEVALWRGAIAANAEDWDRARQEFTFGALAYETAPVEMRTWLCLKSVRSAFATQDLEGGDADLALALEDAPNLALESEAKLLLAGAMAARDDVEAAVELYDEVIAGGYRPLAAEARRDRAELLMARGEIPFEEGMEELERLRFVWRGNDFERDLIMHRLSDMYREEGDYHNGLSTMRELISIFPEHPSTPETTRALNETFRALFLDGLADSMSPVKAYIHWQRQDWIAAATAIDASLGERWKNETPLDDVERSEVMRMTVALSLGGNRTGVDTVRARYGAMMAESPESDAFDVKTTEFDRASIPFREVATTVAQLDTLDAFMAPYREKLQSGGLSAVN